MSVGCYGQEKGIVQEIVTIDDTLYEVSHGELFVIDTKHVLIKPKSSVKQLPENMKQVSKTQSGKILVEVPQRKDLVEYVKELKKSGVFESVEYKSNCNMYFSPNDAKIAHQNSYLSAINAYDAWNITTGNSTIKVAIIDSGIERGHEDLGYGNDNYSNLSYSLGYDYIEGTSYHAPDDHHGTGVAGVLGAKTNNGIGIAGISGGNNCQGVTLVSYRLVHNWGTGPTHLYGDVIRQAVDDGVKIINLSIGHSENDDINSAIYYAETHGVTIVCAAGHSTDTEVPYPACNPYTIAVGEIDDTGATYLGAGLDLVAPSFVYTTHDLNGYWTSTGTSYTAPQVSGTVALMLSVNPSLSPSQIRTILRTTATKVPGYTYDGNGWNGSVGYGLLNAHAAVCAASGISGPTIPSFSSAYSTQNFPSNYSVTWTYTPKSGTSLPSDAFVTNSPIINQCTIKNPNKQYINGILKASILKSGTTVTTLEKEIRSGDGFSATCSQPLGQIVPVSGSVTSNSNTSATFMDDAAFSVKKNSTNSYPVTITSPYFTNATITHTSITGLSWNKTGNTITLSFPANNNLDNPLVVIGKSTTDYRVFRFTIYSQVDIPLQLTATNNGRIISLALRPDEEAARDASTETLRSFADMLVEQEWDVTVANVSTGLVVFEGHTKGASLEIDTFGWTSGIYAINARVGSQKLTQKVVVK